MKSAIYAHGSNGAAFEWPAAAGFLPESARNCRIDVIVKVRGHEAIEEDAAQVALVLREILHARMIDAPGPLDSGEWPTVKIEGQE